MHSKITELQKKQVFLYLCNAVSSTAKRGIEQELRANSELQNYANELKSVIETTRIFSTIKPSKEFLQGNRNLLHGRIQIINNKESVGSILLTVLNKIKSRVTAIAKAQQPVWAVATYVIIGLLAGRLLFSPVGDKPIDIGSQEKVDMNKLIQLGVLSDLRINQSALSPSSIKLVSHSDNRFHVSGNVNDNNIRQILYYLLLNADNIDKQYKAGKLIKKITPNSESRMVLISSILSETDQRVRLQSMETLSRYQSSPNLINACKRILLDDHNSEMRLEALNILANNMSNDLIPLLQVVSRIDDDYSIRDKANELLTELQKPVFIENNEVTQ